MTDQKRSWSEIEKIVHKSRIAQYQHSSFVPSHFTFHKNILIFLGIPPASEACGNENTLVYTDVENGLWESMDLENNGSQASHSYSSYQWHLLIDPDVILSQGTAGYSKEEELLRERKRLVSHGITSYDFHAEAGRLLFPSGSGLYVADVNCITSGLKMNSVPQLIPTNLFASRMDSKLCPSNANIVSFIHNGDIWVVNTFTGHEMRLTFVRSNARDDAVSAGIPAYVIQEEFDRFTGYWWEPRKPSEMEGSLEVHRILYELTDESMVEELHILSAPDSNLSSRVDTFRYPKAGSTNAKSSLRIVEFCMKSSTDEFLDGSIVEYELRVELTDLMPWIEYIVRCGWMPGGKHIWLQVLNRHQTRLAILRIPCTAFRPINSSTGIALDHLRQHKIDILYEEVSHIWINVSDVLHFAPSSNTDVIKFVWLSQETGYRHLVLLNVTTETEDGYIGNQEHITEQNMYYECVVRHCQVLQKAALTSGDWEVDGQKIWVDDKNMLVYFMGLKDTPLESHLYCVSLDSKKGHIHRLTKPGYSHSVSMSKDCSLAVVLSSSLTCLTQANVCKVLQNSSNRRISNGVMSLLGIGWLDPPRQFAQGYVPPELFNYRNSHGYDIYGMLYKPVGCEAGRKYPTLLFVYAGPGVQLVANSQRSVRRLSLYSLTSMGYAVVMIDTMGSANRGLQFEAALKNNLGCIEVDQQIEGLQYIAEQSQVIDMNRVAIHGWSYGGYVSLMALAQRPDIFKVSIAGAPVTSWELYDTGYTERYIDLPANNRATYRKGSILPLVSQFPNEQNRLLIVHGLIDENVHFTHTNALIAELVKEGKPYQLQVYPGERHGIRSPSAAKHYETYVFWILQQTLGSVP